MTFRDKMVAWLRRQGDGGLYREDHFKLGRGTDVVVATLLVIFFVGGFLGFIAWLAASR